MKHAASLLVLSSLFAASLLVGAENTPGFKTIQINQEFWSEGATYGDLNHDEHIDIVVGPYWFEGPTFKTRHEFYPATKTHKVKLSEEQEIIRNGWSPRVYSDNFVNFTHDLNGDGWKDIVVIGFPGKATYWYENNKGGKGLWPRHLILDVTDNESPTFTDLTGNGRPELVCITKGRYGYSAPDGSDASKPWVFHPISPDKGFRKFTHGMGVGDVDGDGRMDLMERGGWWQQPASLANDPEWTHHEWTFGAGGAQMYAYDVNGDGLNDVVTSLVAHGFGLAWFEQVRKGDKIEFIEHIIMNKEASENPYGVKFSMLHALDLADIDRDGLLDIVVGKRYWLPGYRRETEPGSPSPIYWFQLKRKSNGSVEYVPHPVSKAVGVGTQLVVGDLNGDDLLDIISANKQGAFIHLQQK